MERLKDDADGREAILRTLVAGHSAKVSPGNHDLAELGTSRPPIRFKRVDFPDPDLPKRAIRSPLRWSGETPRRTVMGADEAP